MSVREHLARIVGGDVVSWRTMDTCGDALLTACAEHGVTALVHRQVHRHGERCDWPETFRRMLADSARIDAVREAVRRRETASVLGSLDSAGVRPILLKGTPLAYAVYEEPSLRPRSDTDLLVPRAQVDEVRRVLKTLGYEAPPYCDGAQLFGQFEMQRTDHLGVIHAFDIHWRLSTQSMFADALTYEELAAASLRVPDLGEAARSAGLLHSLLLACIHPAMHHRNEDRLIWSLDIHLLAARLTLADFEEFVALAVERRVAAVCAHELGRASATFGTSIPARVSEFLVPARPEPSAVYLEASRRWHHELVSNMRGLPGWKNRLALLREVLLPSPGYMRAVYGIADTWFGVMSLPALYLHRNMYGAWKVLTHIK